MPNVIDQRLASRKHQQQVALLERAEALAVAVGRVYDRLAVSLTALAAGGHSHDDRQQRARALARQAHDEVAKLMADRGAEIVAWSHRATADAYAKTIPAAWWRRWIMARAAHHARHPMARHTHVRLHEARDPDSAGTVVPSVQVVDELEPVRQGAAGWPKTPEEARRFVHEVVIPPLDSTTANRILTSPGHGGLAWQERFRRYAQPDQDRIASGMTEGIAAGESVVALRQRMESIVAGPRYVAQRIARTESCRVASAASSEAVEAGVGDMIAGKQMIITMDQWTRPEHAARSGKMYHRQGPGQYVADDGEAFPGDHYAPNCRCFGSEVLKPPEEFASNPALRAEFQNAQAQDIPDPSSYADWFDGASEGARKTAVGVKRYNAAVSTLGRRPEWSDFIDEGGKLLSAKAIKSEKQKVREERKAAVDAMIGERAELFRQASGMGFLAPDTGATGGGNPAGGDMGNEPPKPPKAPAGAPEPEDSFGVGVPRDVAVRIADPVRFDKTCKTLFDTTLTEPSVVMLGGAARDSFVKVEATRSGLQLEVQAERAYRMSLIARDRQGRLTLRIQRADVPPGDRGQGITSRMTARQISEAQRLGVEYVQVETSRKRGDTGYRYWPLLGFDGPLPKAWLKKHAKELEKLPRIPQRISELMKTAQGVELWNRLGDTIDLTMDLSSKSQQFRVFSRYIRRKRGGWLMESSELVEKRMSWKPRNIVFADLDDDDLRVLREIWDEIAAEDAAVEAAESAKER